MLSSSSPSGTLLDEADEYVREYLTWRGFLSTSQVFTVEREEDNLLGLSSSRLVTKLNQDIETLDLPKVLSWWDNSVGPLLLRVDEDVATVGRSLRDSTYRLYLVTCSKQQRNDLILNFFQSTLNLLDC